MPELFYFRELDSLYAVYFNISFTGWSLPVVWMFAFLVFHSLKCVSVLQMVLLPWIFHYLIQSTCCHCTKHTSKHYHDKSVLHCRGLHEAWFVYIIVVGLVIEGILTKWRECDDARMGTYRLCVSLQSVCILLMALLLRPHNIPLVAMVTYQEHLINYFLLHCKLSIPSASLYFWWMGQATFFYQVWSIYRLGTNSLARAT